MKTQKEIQRAHDLFVGIILGGAPCHDHNTTFRDNMMKLEAWLQNNHGVVLEDHSN